MFSIYYTKLYFLLRKCIFMFILVTNIHTISVVLSFVPGPMLVE